MNYKLTTACICILYTLSLTSSQQDSSTKELTSSPQRPRALTPYATPQDVPQPIQLNIEDSGSDSDKDDEGFCVVRSKSHPSRNSHTMQQEYPASAGQSPVSVAITMPTSSRSQNSLNTEPERSGMPLSSRLWQTTTPAPSPTTILSTLQEQRLKDGLPVLSRLQEVSLAVVKQGSIGPDSPTFSQAAPSTTLIANLGLTQRRNSGSPKNSQLKPTGFDASTDTGRVTPPATSEVSAVKGAAPHRYVLKDTMIQDPALMETAKQLFGQDLAIDVDPEQKTNADKKALDAENAIRPHKKSCSKNCLRFFCCCLLPAKTKNR